MQVTSMIVLLLTAATGALAVPWSPPQPHKPSKPTKNTNTNTNINYQSNYCGNDAQPYCCNAEADDKGVNFYTCSDHNDACNQIVVCCNNNNNNNQQGDNDNNNNGSGNQYCSAFGQQKVVWN